MMPLQEIAKQAPSTSSIILDAGIVTLVVSQLFLVIREWIKMKNTRAAADKAECDAEAAEARAYAGKSNTSDNARPPCLSSPQMATIFSTQAVMKQTQDEMKALLVELTKTQVSHGELMKQLVRSTNILVRCVSRAELKHEHTTVPIVDELIEGGV